MMTNKQQLELGFNQNTTCGYGRKRETRLARGQWWFARMREVVANSIDWQEADQTRPQQSLMPGTNRRITI
jgi:hypothetical protein